jgi:hypothetical protein
MLNLTEVNLMPSMSVRYIIQNTNHQQMHKESFIIIVTHSYMFRPCWVIFRENFFCRYTKVALYSWMRMCCWQCTRGVNFPRSRPAGSTQSTAHSHSTIKCNLSVTITKKFSLKRPSRVETCSSVLQLMIKLSLCIHWWLVFLYNIVHGHGTH